MIKQIVNRFNLDSNSDKTSNKITVLEVLATIPLRICIFTLHTGKRTCLAEKTLQKGGLYEVSPLDHINAMIETLFNFFI